jgi:hypothetical protein
MKWQEDGQFEAYPWRQAYNLLRPTTQPHLLTNRVIRQNTPGYRNIYGANLFNCQFSGSINYKGGKSSQGRKF